MDENYTKFINFIKDFKLLVKDISNTPLHIKDDDVIYPILIQLVNDYNISKELFVNNLKSLNIDINYKYNINVKVFNIGDNIIDVAFIIEFDNIDDIFDLIKDMLKKQNLDINPDNLLYTLITYLDKIYINLNKFIHIINMNINPIHLNKILTEIEDDNICNICLEDVDNKSYADITTCKICSFKYCKKCYSMIDKCSSCNHIFL